MADFVAVVVVVSAVAGVVQEATLAPELELEPLEPRRSGTSVPQGTAGVQPRGEGIRCRGG